MALPANSTGTEPTQPGTESAPPAAPKPEKPGKWLRRSGYAVVAVALGGLVATLLGYKNQSEKVDEFRGARAEILRRQAPITMYGYIQSTTANALASLAKKNPSSTQPELIPIPETYASIAVVAGAFNPNSPNHSRLVRELIRNNIVRNGPDSSQQCVILDAQVNSPRDESVRLPTTLVCKAGSTTSILPYDITESFAPLHPIATVQQFANFLAGKPSDQETARTNALPSQEDKLISDSPAIVSSYIANLQGSRLAAAVAADPRAGGEFDSFTIPSAKVTMRIFAAPVATIPNWTAINQSLGRAGVLTTQAQREANCFRLDILSYFADQPTVSSVGRYSAMTCFGENASGAARVFTDPNIGVIPTPLPTTGAIRDDYRAIIERQKRDLRPTQ